jgi:hypothetical protein
MNDTRGHAHFGCQRVMRVIEQNLESRGVKVTARSLVRNDWPSDRTFLEAASAADIIVINGEGTLHHGARPGELLLQIADHPVRAGKPVALINAIYQENPEHWRRYLDAIDLISPRDSWSAAVLSEATGRKIEHVPDLSMAEGFHPAADTSERTILTIGESVLRDTRNELIALFQKRPEAYFLPIVGTIKSPKLRSPQPLRALRKLYVELHSAAFKARNRRAIFAQDEFDYADALLRSTLHASGRFHAICFALTTKTPFLALSSNAWKVEALFEDMGIDKRRLVPFDRIDQLISVPADLGFQPEEMLRIEHAMAAGTRAAGETFDQIAKLARLKR